MACFYNEKVRKKSIPYYVLLLLFGATLLGVSAVAKTMNFSAEFVVNLDLVLTLIFLVAGYGVFKVSQEYYKYAVIEQELLIHKVTKDQSILVERVKLHDVEYLGKVSKGNGNLKRFFHNRSGDFFRCSAHCIYQGKGKRRHLYFSPSHCLLEKLEQALEQYRQ